MASDSGNSRPAEQPAVKTTIVGGRPPGTGKGLGDIPHGIEVLIKKAVVDHEFRALLLEKRAEAAKEIGLELSEPEAALLNAAPAEQLRLVIARTRVSRKQRAAFVGRAAAVMLAAVTTGALKYGCDQWVEGERERGQWEAFPVTCTGIIVGPDDDIRELNERRVSSADSSEPEGPAPDPKESKSDGDEARKQ